MAACFLAYLEEEFDGATIEGDGPGDLDFDPEEADFVNVEGKDYAYVTFESKTALTAGTVNWYHPLTIKWTLKASGRSLSGSSDNETFLTLGAPQCTTLYRTVAYLACSNRGATDADVALAHTWNLFSTGSGPADVCGWNDDTRWYDRPLHYYLHSNSNTSATALLASGDGQCGAWADLFGESLLANGVNGGQYAKVIPKTCDWFGVKNIGFGQPTYENDPPFIYLHNPFTDSGDLNTAVSGLPGQNTDPPAEKLFNLHFIYLYEAENGTYTDPSYGVTYTGPADFVSQAVKV